MLPCIINLTILYVGKKHQKHHKTVLKFNKIKIFDFLFLIWLCDISIYFYQSNRNFMIKLNNILVKCSAVLLVACIQTSCLFAMDSGSGSDSDKENGSKRRRLEAHQPEVIDLTGDDEDERDGSIRVTVNGKTKNFFDSKEASICFKEQVKLGKIGRIVAKANKKTEKSNAKKNK
jgi:hypothetical protein